MLYLKEMGLVILKDIKELPRFQAEVNEAVYFLDFFNKVYAFRYINEYKRDAWMIDLKYDLEERKTLN